MIVERAPRLPLKKRSELQAERLGDKEAPVGRGSPNQDPTARVRRFDRHAMKCVFAALWHPDEVRKWR